VEGEVEGDAEGEVKGDVEERRFSAAFAFGKDAGFSPRGPILRWTILRVRYKVPCDLPPRS
jgi:hypothetical protein